MRPATRYWVGFEDWWVLRNFGMLLVMVKLYGYWVVCWRELRRF